MNFIITKFMYPIREKMDVLEGYYFDNPRTSEEIKYIADIIRKSTPFPPNDRLAGEEGYITLDYVVDKFKSRYLQDKYVVDFIENSKYKDPCYKIASMWVILRFKDDFQAYEYDKVIERTKNYIDTITLLSFDVNNYAEFSILVTDEYFGSNNEMLYNQVQNSILELTVESSNRREREYKKEEYRFNGFIFYYNNIKEVAQKILEFSDRETIKYITECIQCLRKNYDLKMKFVSIVSIIELLLTHSPNTNRYNVEDSISKQFRTKVALITYLNDKSQNYENIIKESNLIYSLRSDIAHGNFKQLDKDLKKYFNFYKEKYNSRIVKYDKIYTMDKLICRTLKYMTIVFKEYLNDYTLLNIIKEI